MKIKKVFIGIDVSKEKLDLCVQIGDLISQEIVLLNTISELKKFFRKFFKEHNAEDILLCCEHMGHYVYPLCCVCEDLNLDLWIENPYQIKHSSGLQRGKNDKVDARRIVEYAIRYQDKVRLFSLPDKNISSLRILISERDLYVTHRSTYQGQLSDQERFMSRSDFAAKSKRLKTLITDLDDFISAIDEHINELLENDVTLSEQHKLLCSIDGVGSKTATKMIATTNAFRDFDNGRSFCCYVGVAPFEYTSGSSVRSKNRVSQKADKNIKALLHLCALAAAINKKDSDLRDYYLRKVAEGRNKMSVLNAVRGKLILRMFAVIRDNRMYDRNYAAGFG